MFDTEMGKRIDDQDILGPNVFQRDRSEAAAIIGYFPMVAQYQVFIIIQLDSVIISDRSFAKEILGISNTIDVKLIVAVFDDFTGQADDSFDQILFIVAVEREYLRPKVKGTKIPSKRVQRE